MAKKIIYEFERCEAKKLDGLPCRSEAIEYVRNIGAPFPYQVCGIHKRRGEHLLATTGGLPRNWGRYS